MVYFHIPETIHGSSVIGKWVTAGNLQKVRIRAMEKKKCVAMKSYLEGKKECRAEEN